MDPRLPAGTAPSGGCPAVCPPRPPAGTHVRPRGTALQVSRQRGVVLCCRGPGSGQHLCPWGPQTPVWAAHCPGSTHAALRSLPFGAWTDRGPLPAGQSRGPWRRLLTPGAAPSFKGCSFACSFWGSNPRPSAPKMPRTPFRRSGKSSPTFQMTDHSQAGPGSSAPPDGPPWNTTPSAHGRTLLLRPSPPRRQPAWGPGLSWPLSWVLAGQEVTGLAQAWATCAHTSQPGRWPTARGHLQSRLAPLPSGSASITILEPGRQKSLSSHSGEWPPGTPGGRKGGREAEAAEARRSRRRRLAGQARLPAGTKATASRASCLPSFQTRTGSRASPGLAGPEAAPWGRALSGSERRSLFPGAGTEAVAGAQGTDPSPGGFLGHGEAGPSPRSDCQGHLPSLPGPTRHQPACFPWSSSWGGGCPRGGAPFGSPPVSCGPAGGRAASSPPPSICAALGRGGHTGTPSPRQPPPGVLSSPAALGLHCAPQSPTPQA